MREEAARSQPSPREVRELLEIARLAAINEGAQHHELDDIASITASKLTERWNDTGVQAARNNGPSAWHRYISVTARHSFYDMLRTQQRDRDRQAKASGLSTEPNNDRPGVQRAAESPPTAIDDYVSARIVLDLIDEAGLSERERNVMALTVIEGLGTHQIGERLGLSDQVVNRHRRDAIAKLRAHVEALTDDG